MALSRHGSKKLMSPKKMEELPETFVHEVKTEVKEINIKSPLGIIATLKIYDGAMEDVTATSRYGTPLTDACDEAWNTLMGMSDAQLEDTFGLIKELRKITKEIGIC